MLHALVALVLPALLAAQPPLANGVTIRRDTYGVPHIYAPTDAGVVFGLMYAQAEDNFWQLEEDYIFALGRAAEVYGDSVAGNDVSARLFEVEPRAKVAYRRATPRMRAIYDAFAGGVNWYIANNPDAPPRLLTRFEPWYALVNEIESPAFDLSSVIDGVRLRDWTIVDTRDALEREEGSNMWALGPSRTTTGHPLLFINPHVGFFGAGQRYELHLESGQGWRFSGFAILGTPIPRTGHSDVLGWSHTNNYADVRDVYVEKFDDPARPMAYRYGRGWRTAVEWNDSIRVRRSDGTSETRRLTLRKTHRGPIIASRAGEALALALPRPDGGSLEQRYLMGKARSFAAWKRAMGRGRVVGSNTMYADRAGNIFYVHGNAIPKRSADADPTRPLDGTDPRTDWQGYYSLDELPHLQNPKSGYLISTNSSPWHMTIGAENPDSTRWPAWVAPEPFNARARSSHRIIGEREKFSFDELARAGFDRRVFVADSLVPLLVDEWERLRAAGSARADSTAALVAELRGWDRRSDTASVAMTLFFDWSRRLRAADSSGWRLTNRMADVRRELDRDFGTWRVHWGDVNRLQRVHTSGREPFSDARPSFPVAGGPPSMGIIFAFNAREERGQKRIYGVSGNTYVSVVELGPTVRARSLLVFGQSADSASPNFLDQATLYANGRTKEAWFSRDEVAKNTARTYRPGASDMKPAARTVDVLFLHGTLVDGTGAPSRVADVGIDGDRIVFIGDAGRANVTGRRTIEARGLIVAPGFIDPHSHTQEDLSNADKSRRANVNYLMQGVTTVITGNDGGGPVDVKRVLEGWEREGIGTNGALLVGQGAVRQRVLRMSDAAPSAAQLDSMRRLVAQAMDDGALGMSTGLYYAPGSYATTEEVIALAKVAGEKGGVYDSHLRDESSYTIGLLGAVREAIRIAREAQIPVNISHIKALGTDVWGRSDSVIALIRAARAEGLRISADQYPYTASGSSVGASLLPRWAEAGGRDSLLARIADPPTRERLVRDMTENLRRRGGAASLLITSGRDQTIIGKNLGEIATARGLPPIEAAIEIIRGGDASVASFNMSDRDIEAFLVQDFVSTGSDGSGGHPRKYGTFPRVLREYVYNKKLLTIEQAVERGSSRTAAAFGLTGRGTIAEGALADVIAFDPRTIADRATYREPRLLATGMRWVVVNGVVAIADGEYTGALAGKAVRRAVKPKAD